MKRTDVRGVIVAIATPFKSDETVDLDGLNSLANFLVKSGVHAIMTTGGTGEFPHLMREEKKAVIQAIVQAASGRIPVIAGTAACSTREAILLANDAKEAGADAVIVTPPFYFKLPDSSNFEHFQVLAKNIDLPIVVYNNPLYTGNNLSPDLIDRIAGINGVIGLKQSNSDLGQLVENIRLSGDKISINTGIDSQFYPALCAGASGIFSTAACVIPKQMVEIYDAFNRKDFDLASETHRKIQSLNRLLEYDPGYVSPCKEALRLLGLPGGPVRKPLPELSALEKETLRKSLMSLGLI